MVGGNIWGIMGWAHIGLSGEGRNSMDIGIFV